MKIMGAMEKQDEHGGILLWVAVSLHGILVVEQEKNGGSEIKAAAYGHGCMSATRRLFFFCCRAAVRWFV